MSVVRYPATSFTIDGILNTLSIWVAWSANALKKAVESLVTGFYVRFPVGEREAAGGFPVVDLHIHVDPYPAEGVHHRGEAPEVDLRVVVDRHAREGCHRLGHELGAAVEVRGVDLVHAVSGDLHAGVAGNGEHPYHAFLRVDPREDDGVGSRRLFAVTEIGAEEQDRVRLLGLALGERLAHVGRLERVLLHDPAGGSKLRVHVRGAAAHEHQYEQRETGDRPLDRPVAPLVVDAHARRRLDSIPCPARCAGLGRVEPATRVDAASFA
jgi:hypothetical protein